MGYPDTIYVVDIQLYCKIVIIPAFFYRKKGILISCQSTSIVRPSVLPCERPSVTFLVNVSPPKPLQVATSNFEVQ